MLRVFKYFVEFVNSSSKVKVAADLCGVFARCRLSLPLFLWISFLSARIMICKFLENIKGEKLREEDNDILRVTEPDSAALSLFRSRFSSAQLVVSALAAHLISTAFVTANILFARFVLRFLSLGAI